MARRRDEDEYDDEREERPRARRRHDEENDDDDRPRARRRRDEDDDDEYDDERPRRRRPRRQQDIGQDAGMRMLMPVGRSGWAIAAGYLGLISVLVFPAPFAVLAGILAIREMKRDPEKHGMGRAIFGLLMGGLFTLALFVVIGVALFSKK